MTRMEKRRTMAKVLGTTKMVTGIKRVSIRTVTEQRQGMEYHYSQYHLVIQEHDSFRSSSGSHHLEVTYTDSGDADMHSTEDELTDHNNLMAEEILVDNAKAEEYHNNQEPEIEEAILDDRNYAYNKSDGDIFEHDLTYDQNGSDDRGQQFMEMHAGGQKLRHFRSSVTSSSERLRYDKELIDFQKELMQKEFDEVRAMRQEKHKLEMQILSAELKHKFIEHQKQLEILNKRMMQDA